MSGMAHILRPAMVALVLLQICIVQGSLPHVSECNFCMKCTADADGVAAVEASAAAARRLSTDDEDLMQQPMRTLRQREDNLSVDAISSDASTRFSKIFPLETDIKAKQLLPNCTECRGCEIQLRPLKAVLAFGQDFNAEIGASPEWIFTTNLPASQGGGEAVIKVWCVPIDKVRKTFQWNCQKNTMAERANRFLAAQQRVVEECGLMDTTVRVWVAPVNAIDPATGLHIWWNGLWMQRAEGISLNQLSYITRKTFVEDTIMDLLQTKLNKTLVIRSAIHDLITCQCDRHAQNVFINENGNIRLIDNLNALKFNWVKCGTDSIFLPGTQKNEIARSGGNLVWKKAGARAKRSVNPMVLLDYRCYIPGGKIGTDYPPQVTQCLRKLSAMTPTEIMEEYEFPHLRHSETLSIRVKDMLAKGFEYSLTQGEPLNMHPKRYRLGQPCCKLAVENHVVKCGHAWNATKEFPKGEPLHGIAWTRKYPDPGTYDGGTDP